MNYDVVDLVKFLAFFCHLYTYVYAVVKHVITVFSLIVKHLKANAIYLKYKKLVILNYVSFVLI